MIDPTLMRCDLITWGEVLRLAKRVAARIRTTGFRPDVVVAIARGGYVPARLLCDLLDLYDLVSMRIGHYRGGARVAGEASISSPLAVDVRGLDVLLVDDVSDSGATLRLAVDHIRDFGPRSLKVAVLHHKRVSPVVPDFFGQEVLSWRWLVYPWAITEDLGGFVAAMDPRPDSLEDVVERLRRDHGIRVSKRIAADVLALQRQQESPIPG